MSVIPPFNNLRAFEAAGRSGSFKAAAHELNLTPSAISHRISALEEMLGKPMFISIGRGVELTDAGREYIISVRKIFDELSVATDKVKYQGVRGPLTIRLYPTFGHRWLLPRLQTFCALHPDIEINLISTPKPFDFSSNDTDVAIEYSEEPWYGYDCEIIMSEEVVPVCSAQFYTLAGRPEDARRIPAQTLIHCISRPGEWEWWLSEAQITGQLFGRTIRVSTREFAIDAAAGGLGVALAHRPLVDIDLKNGRIIAPFKISVPTPLSY